MLKLVFAGTPDVAVPSLKAFAADPSIREKIELNPKEPEYLKVVWGIGYKIEKH